MFNPFDLYTIPLQERVAAAIDWLTTTSNDEIKDGVKLERTGHE